MENRYEPRSFVNGRIKLSRESAITKSIVSKAEVTMLRGNASCYRVSEKQSFLDTATSWARFTSGACIQTKRRNFLRKSYGYFARWTLPSQAMAPFALTIFQLPRVDVKLDAVYGFLRLYLFFPSFYFFFIVRNFCLCTRLLAIEI